MTELKQICSFSSKSVIQSVKKGSIKVFSGSMLVCLPTESEIVITSEKSALKVKRKAYCNRGLYDKQRFQVHTTPGNRLDCRR